MSSALRLSSMRGRTFALAASLVLALIVASGGLASADVLKVGDRLPELDVAVDANGKAFKLKAFKDKWVLVTVGAAWCKPCKKELPTWDKLAPEVKEKITFIALGLDDEIATGKDFHKKLKLKNMRLAYMPSDKSGVAASYGAATMPSTFIADPRGVVRYVHNGFEERDASGEYDKMKKKIAELVK